MSTTCYCGHADCPVLGWNQSACLAAVRARAERAEAALRACDEALDELGCGACAVPPEADVGAVPGAVREAMTTLRARLAEEQRQHVESRRELSMAVATAQDVARRQREADLGTLGESHMTNEALAAARARVRATPLVTDQEESK